MNWHPHHFLTEAESEALVERASILEADGVGRAEAERRALELVLSCPKKRVRLYSDAGPLFGGMEPTLNTPDDATRHAPGFSLHLSEDDISRRTAPEEVTTAVTSRRSRRERTDPLPEKPADVREVMQRVGAAILVVVTDCQQRVVWSYTLSAAGYICPAPPATRADLGTGPWVETVRVQIPFGRDGRLKEVIYTREDWAPNPVPKANKHAGRCRVSDCKTYVPTGAGFYHRTLNPKLMCRACGFKLWPELVALPDGLVEFTVMGKPRLTSTLVESPEGLVRRIRVGLPTVAEREREAEEFTNSRERYWRTRNRALGAGVNEHLATAKKNKDWRTLGWAERVDEGGQIAERLREASHSDLADAMGACGCAWDVRVAPHVEKEWPVAPHTCGLRICPIDAYFDGRDRARTATAVAALRGATPATTSMHTLTIKNTEELAPSLDDLRVYFLRYAALLEVVFPGEFCESIVPGLVRSAVADADGGGALLEVVPEKIRRVDGDVIREPKRGIVLRSGDVVLEANGNVISSGAALLNVIDCTPVGTSLRLRVRREHSDAERCRSSSDFLYLGEPEVSDDLSPPDSASGWSGGGSSLPKIEELELVVTVTRQVRGGVRALETTWKLAADWHSHIHALIEGGFVEQQFLSVLWWVASAGRGYVMEVERLRGSMQSAARETIKNPAKVTDQMSRVIEDAVFEAATRYMTKVLSCADGNKIEELHRAIKGRRLVELIGGWRDLQEHAEEAVAAEDADTESKIPTECPCGCGEELEVVNRWYGGWKRIQALKAYDSGEPLPLGTGVPVPSG